MKLTILTIAVIIVNGIVPFENPYGIMYPRGGNEDWGDGAFVVPDQFQIDLYSDLHGAKFGEVRNGKSYLELYDFNGEKILQYPVKDLEWIGHYNYELLKYKEVEDTEYVKILWKHFPPGLYVKRAMIEEFGFESFSYREYLFGTNLPNNLKLIRNGTNIGVNLEKSCLNLRSSPIKESQKIECIPGNDWGNGEFNHLKIIKTEKKWALIEVSFYCIDDEDESSEYSCTGKKIRSKKGWVKAIDENGFPNIWFSVTSY